MVDILNPTQLLTAAAQNSADNRASEFAEHLRNRIVRFANSLDDAHEVGLQLGNFNPGYVFHLQQIRYANPSLIFFVGRTDASDPVELLQHVSQINMVLTQVSRLNPEEPKRPIGFQAHQPEA